MYAKPGRLVARKLRHNQILCRSDTKPWSKSDIKDKRELLCRADGRTTDPIGVE
jgi:hypothetical protein